MGQTGIYIHIPFCVRKCSYCDFLSFPAGEQTRENYVRCLVREIKRAETVFPDNRRADTVFFGGGTPSLLSLSQTERILEALRRTFAFDGGAEVTMECNPGTGNDELLSGLYRAGINRISFGVQSAVDTELFTLGRIHRFREAADAVRMAREAGFQNINLDIMSAIPGQTKESWLETLTKAAELKPQHISAYSLIIEEGTPFYDKYAEHPPVDEETDRWMYAMTKQKLLSYGYERYEISNYAMPGFECRHNLKYWSGEDYIGFGLGASSKVGNVRYRNEADLAGYMDKIRKGIPAARVEEILDREERMSEYMILGLRRTRGVSISRFETLFGIRLEDVYGDAVERFVSDGLLQRESDRLFFTDYGLDVSNFVLCEFLCGQS